MNKQGNMVKSTKSPYTSVVVDSDTERNFAQGLENNDNVIVYTN